MKILNKNSSICFLIVLLVFSRLIPHPPNFTPLIALTVLSGLLFKNFYISIFVLVSSMFFSDVIIGFHKNMIFIYLILILIGALFFKFANNFNSKNLLGFSLTGALLFYLLSNFIVWTSSGMYSYDLKGLLECYILALPFLSNTIISTVFFSYLTFFCINKVNNYFYKIKKN